MNRGKEISLAGEFITTVADLSGLKQAIQGPLLKGKPESRIAMVGRSNVGKSSLLNALLGARVAQVSNRPGKTRAIHFYLWKESKRIIADLPGYGFAKASREERDAWARFILQYIRADENLDRALVLLDSRIGPTALDEEAIRFLSFQKVPVTFVFTKADVLKTQSDRIRRHREAARALSEFSVSPEQVFWVSSRTRDGLKELARALTEE